MIIGTVREVKHQEYRVGLTPAAVRELAAAGHELLVEAGAGVGAHCPDAAYEAAGATLTDAAGVWARSELLVKVKEPQPAELEHLRPGLCLFTYLHLAAFPELTRALLASGVTAIAYETVRDAAGELPCLRPMSQIAGRLATQEGAHFLGRPHGGRGVLLGGVPGVPRGRVTVLGGGVVGSHAAEMAMGLGARVTILDIDPQRLAWLDRVFGNRLDSLHSSPAAIAETLADSDLVIGAVLLPGKRAPSLIRREHLRDMRPGALIVDVAVDQGGCCETTRATTHDDPVYTVDGIQHYAVANMPGAVPVTSTRALINATLPYVRTLAARGWRRACRESAALAAGLNVHAGCLCEPGVADSLELPLTPVEAALEATP